MEFWKPLRYALCATILAAGAACSATTFAAEPAPCSLVTTAEVEQVIGKLKGQPEASKEGEAAWCNYEFANGNDAMEIWVFPADAIDRARKIAKKPVVVKGLGNEALMDRGAFGLDYVDLYIKKGNITIKLALRETAGDEEKLKTLAKKAVGRF